jgi:hypothetical protein
VRVIYFGFFGVCHAILYDWTNSEFSVVAVHGLNGHSEKTWTADNGVNWLRDLLPEDFPMNIQLGL